MLCIVREQYFIFACRRWHSIIVSRRNLLFDLNAKRSAEEEPGEKGDILTMNHKQGEHENGTFTTRRVMRTCSVFLSLSIHVCATASAMGWNGNVHGIRMSPDNREDFNAFECDCGIAAPRSKKKPTTICRLERKTLMERHRNEWRALWQTRKSAAHKLWLQKFPFDLLFHPMQLEPTAWVVLCFFSRLMDSYRR